MSALRRRGPAASVGAMLRLVLAGLVFLLAIAPAAHAASTNQILRDCADDGVLQGNYSPAELRKARQHIPADTDQYTDCRDVLARAASAGFGRSGSGRGGSGGSGGGTGGGSSSGGSGGGQLLTPASDADNRALDTASKAGTGPVDIDGRTVVPGAVGFDASAARNDLPSTLLVVLILLGAGVLAAAVPKLRRSGLAATAGARALVRRHVLHRG
jgi:hypothetical protein